MSGLSFDEMNNWRKDAKSKLLSMADDTGYRLTVFNPVDFYNFEIIEYQSDEEVMDYDLFHVEHSNFLVVNADGLEDSKGTIMEIFDAWIHKIPVFVFGDYKHHHPWIERCVTRFEPNIDAVVEYLPSPLDIPPVKGTTPGGEEAEREASDSAPMSALAFKIATDPFVGRLAFFRVYTGTARSGSYVLNSTKGVKERFARLVYMHSNHRQETEEVPAGDIAAAIGLKNTTTGDTLCDENKVVILEKMEFPEPVIEQAIEPKTKADQEKMTAALVKLAEEDPTLKVYTNNETGQTIIAGVGELHLDIVVDRLKREFNVNCNVGAPQVGYRETIRRVADCEGKYIKQSGGRGQYGHVWIKFEPNPGKGFEFVDAIVGGTVPREYIKPTGEGLKDALERGLVAGYPVVDIKATLFDGSYHDVDSSEAAYKIAASMALKEAAKKCDPVILEPIMKVEITVPEQYYGDVIGDISKRRGNMIGESQRGNAKIVDAFIPLSEMFGYVTDLRSFTQGRGSYSMQFDHFGETPRFIADEIIKKSGMSNR